ncbi:MAG: putative phytoene dehydrogenase [Actinomycetia bacterium]|nr:putative phytoene dehydrogenase [Actinomycetes bacterium]
MSDHDVVVVGAGHNGLICAAYLARAGLDVLVLEARPEVGGCASTVDAIEARVNICNCDHLTFRTTPIADELDLADHGLRYLDVEPAQLAVMWDGGRPWTLSHDVETTIESIRGAQPGEVDGYRRYVRAAMPVAELVLELACVTPSFGNVTRRLLERRASGLATLLAWSRRSATDVLRSFLRTDDLLGPVLATGPAVWGITGDHPRTGLAAAGYALKHVAQVGRPEGGSGALTDAVAASLAAAGGKVRTSARVASILCEGERVRGVELDDGEVITAGRVVVACDPRRALLQWLRDPPASMQPLLDRWATRPELEGYESKLDAVVAEPPRFAGHDGELVPTAVVSPSVAGLAHGFGEATAGRIPQRPPLLVNVPSVLDPTMRTADGDHVLSLEVLNTPYSLQGGWPGSAEPERWLGLLGSLAQPGFLDGVRRWRVMTPPDYERDFSMVRGHAPSFVGGPLAALLGRDRELTRYETPVTGLHLTGAATFPGAGVWGASGRNTAATLLR